MSINWAFLLTAFIAVSSRLCEKIQIIDLDKDNFITKIKSSNFTNPSLPQIELIDIGHKSLKVSKSRKQKHFFSLLPKNEQKTFVGSSNKDKYFVRFLGRIKNKYFCFRNLLTFTYHYRNLLVCSTLTFLICVKETNWGSKKKKK